jgi:hypothetical protein
MNCHEAEDQLTSYLDLELSLGERESMKEHLLSCSRCREALNDLKKVGQWVHLVQTEPDLYFEKQSLRVIKSSVLHHEKKMSWRPTLGNFFRLPYLRPAATAFIFLFAVLTAYYLGYQSHPFWVAQSVGVSQRDLEKINQEIDFYRDYELIHQLDLLKKMDQERQQGKEESL